MHVSDEFADVIKRHKPQSLSLAAFCAYLIEQALDNGVTLGLPSAAKEVPLSSSITSKRTNKKKNIYTGLEQHQELIEEFWRVKKGSKSDQGWKLLNTELLKIKEHYGDKVVEEQLQLAINGLWKGVSLRLYEQFKAPKGNHAPEPAKHPAGRVYTAKDFELPPVASDNPLKELF